MGIFDAPTPVFGWLDAQMGLVMPGVIRLILWGVVGALVSMLLYRAISAQERVAQGKQEIAAARQALDAYDGEFTGAWPLMRHLLRAAFAQVGRVGWPAVVASLPLLCLLVWVSTAYGYRYPANGDTPEIHTTPSQLDAAWIRPSSGGTQAAPPRIVIRDAEHVLVDVPLAVPTPVVHKRRWWNTMIGNPAGYLPPDGAVDEVSVRLPRKEYLPVGPGWMRGWEVVFFVPLLVVSIALKVLVRIE